MYYAEHKLKNKKLMGRPGNEARYLDLHFVYIFEMGTGTCAVEYV